MNLAQAPILLSDKIAHAGLLGIVRNSKRGHNLVGALGDLL